MRYGFRRTAHHRLFPDVAHAIHAVRSEEHTSELQSLSLHEALPISSEDQSKQKILPEVKCVTAFGEPPTTGCSQMLLTPFTLLDRKSTRLNSSHFPYTKLFRSHLRTSRSRKSCPK